MAGGWTTTRRRLVRESAPRRTAVRGSERGGALADRGLLVRGLVLVDHACRRGLVELAAGVCREALGLVDVAGVCGLAEPAHGGLQRGLDRLVALVRRCALSVALDLGLDVRHGAGLVRWSVLDLGCGSRRGARRFRARAGVRTRKGSRYQRRATRPKSIDALDRNPRRLDGNA